MLTQLSSVGIKMYFAKPLAKIAKHEMTECFNQILKMVPPTTSSATVSFHMPETVRWNLRVQCLNPRNSHRTYEDFWLRRLRIQSVGIKGIADRIQAGMSASVCRGDIDTDRI